MIDRLILKTDIYRIQATLIHIDELKSRDKLANIIFVKQTDWAWQACQRSGKKFFREQSNPSTQIHRKMNDQGKYAPWWAIVALVVVTANVVAPVIQHLLNEEEPK